MKRKIYLVPSLIAAGFMPSKATAMPAAGIMEKKSPQSMFDRLRIKHVYTLAGHSSHSSHASHASHASGVTGGYIPRATYDNTYTAPDPSPSYTPAPKSKAPPIYSPPPPAVYVAPAQTSAPVTSPATSTTQAPPASPAPLKVLPGNTDRFKRIVIQVQTGLIAFGYYPGPVTGQVDAATKVGLSKMQDAYKLKVTGTITPEVLTALGIAAN